MPHEPTAPSLFLKRARKRLVCVAIALLACAIGNGCAAVSNPVAQGIPVRRVPPEYLGIPKELSKTIPLTLLRQPAPDAHHLDGGDVLGVFIEGVLGEKGVPPPVRFPEQGNLPPALGYPVVVNEDGTLQLPYIAALDVKDLTIRQVRELIRKTYVDEKILKSGKEQILVSLLRPRQVRVQVVRQDSQVANIAPGIGTNTRRGTAATVDLPAYENDVLGALTRTGGLPGLDAINEIVIQRFAPRGAGEQANAGPIRIPLRIREGEPIPFQQADVILKAGDIVFIEARDTEVYYMGGLVLPKQFILPRDLDVRVVDAIALAGGPLVNGGVTQNNLSGNIIASGLGSPSPSLVTVLRRTKSNGQVKIIVDLNRALNDPRENILIQAGDVIISQETVGEALTRYGTSIFRYNLFGTFSMQGAFTGTSTVAGP